MEVHFVPNSIKEVKLKLYRLCHVLRVYFERFPGFTALVLGVPGGVTRPDAVALVSAPCTFCFLGSGTSSGGSVAGRFWLGGGWLEGGSA